MKRIITLASILVMAQAHSLAQTKSEISALQSAVEQNLSENILPFWTQNTVDPDGGFYGTVVDKGNAVTDAERGAILNARITGLPAGTTTAVVRITNDKQHAEAFSLTVHNGSVDVDMPADSFVTILAQ